MDFKTIRDFYNRLQDEESRYIFDCRINYLFSGRRSHLRKMAEDVNRLFHPSKLIKNFRALLDNNEKRDLGVVLYGAGTASGIFLRMFEDARINVLAFCDTNAGNKNQTPESRSHLGLPLLTLNELLRDKNYRNCSIVPSSDNYQAEICDLLIQRGISHERLFVVDGEHLCSNYIYQRSYFGPEFMRPEGREAFVDAGCFNGGDIRQFIKWCGGNYTKIFGLEPNPEQYKMTVDNIASWGYENVTIAQKGAWSSNGELNFLPRTTGNSTISKTEMGELSKMGTTTVSVTPIDDLVGDEPITFIKMDIEGAELEALKGAKNVILRDKPKLAICIYHKPEDILEIPSYLYGLIPEYRFYIRHHNYIRPSEFETETVLYAI